MKNSECKKNAFERFRSDFPQFSERFLKIADKRGKLSPLILNQAQLYVHERLETQRRVKGNVRALVLKGRQQGISTYTEARFLWRAMFKKGTNAVVMAHKADSTSAIFGMVRRYVENLPDLMQPFVGEKNQSTLKFSMLDSSYRVATAGSNAIGRGWTAQMLHGSEFAFWDNAEEHFSGIGQAIADAKGTEVILESTANCAGDVFHQLWQKAEQGISDFIPIFVPWFWQDEYSRAVPKDFKLTEEESRYLSAYKLTLEQIAWRRAKIETDFNGDFFRFAREYPATAAEAFQTNNENSFISADSIIRARKHKVCEPFGAVVMGVDPARFGDDRTAIVIRRGREIVKMKAFEKKSTMETVGLVLFEIKQFKPVKVFVDVVGLGAGVVDRLNELGYGRLIVPINAGERANESTLYYNRRAEMWANMRDWLNGGGVSIPDDDSLHADLAAPSYTYDSSQRLKLESKEDMRKRGIRSPDLADALGFTFAFPVAAPEFNDESMYSRRFRDSITGY